MKTNDAIQSFNGVASLARALNITTAAIYQWGEEVPALRAYQIRDILDKQPTQPAQEHKEAA